jgi:hypothetical protein
MSSETGTTWRTRRRGTWLAAERTYLAWLHRAGRAGFASPRPVAAGVVDADPASACSAGLRLLGVFLFSSLPRPAYPALAPGAPAMDFWAVWVLTAWSCVLAVATIVLVIAEV